MIFKTGLQRFLLRAFIPLMIMCNCINDPANEGWEPEKNFLRRNDLPGLYKVLCDKNGKYYGLTNYNVITFDKTVLHEGSHADTLPGSQYADNIFFDINQDLIVLNNYGLKRYRSGPAGFQVEDLDISVKNLRLINKDNGVAMLMSRPDMIMCWNGVSFTCVGYVPEYSFYDVVGVFFHEKGLEVFTNFNSTFTRLLVNGSSILETEIITDSIFIKLMLKKWQIFIGTGAIPDAKYTTFILFTISDQNTFHVIDTIYGYVSDFIETDNAIYLKVNNSIYRITPGKVNSIDIDYRISGPLILDHNGRPAIFYQNTIQNIYIDSWAMIMRRSGPWGRP